jgi:hypothetical protein
MSRVTDPSRELDKKVTKSAKENLKKCNFFLQLCLGVQFCRGTHITALFGVIENKLAFHHSLKLPQTSQKGTINVQLMLN